MGKEIAERLDVWPLLVNQTTFWGEGFVPELNRNIYHDTQFKNIFHFSCTKAPDWTVPHLSIKTNNQKYDLCVIVEHKSGDTETYRKRAKEEIDEYWNLITVNTNIQYAIGIVLLWDSSTNVRVETWWYDVGAPTLVCQLCGTAKDISEGKILERTRQWLNTRISTVTNPLSNVVDRRSLLDFFEKNGENIPETNIYDRDMSWNGKKDRTTTHPYANDLRYILEQIVKKQPSWFAVKIKQRYLDRETRTEQTNTDRDGFIIFVKTALAKGASIQIVAASGRFIWLCVQTIGEGKIRLMDNTARDSHALDWDEERLFPQLRDNQQQTTPPRPEELLYAKLEDLGTTSDSAEVQARRLVAYYTAKIRRETDGWAQRLLKKTLGSEYDLSKKDSKVKSHLLGNWRSKGNRPAGPYIPLDPAVDGWYDRKSGTLKRMKMFNLAMKKQFPEFSPFINMRNSTFGENTEGAAGVSKIFLPHKGPREVSLYDSNDTFVGTVYVDFLKDIDIDFFRGRLQKELQRINPNDGIIYDNRGVGAIVQHTRIALAMKSAPSVLLSKDVQRLIVAA